jgi:Berberine and berberine like/FAD binding domain
LQILAALPFARGLFGGSAAAAATAPFSRVRPGDPQWPCDGVWEELGRRLEGQLIKVASPLSACVDAPSPDVWAHIARELKNPYYLGDEVGLTEKLGWVGAWTSRPSVYAVAAKSTAAVVAAVNFARTHKLRLVVKGGWHSYQGTSNAADSLLIWTRPMSAVVLHDAFVGSGCKGRVAPQPAVSVEAGAIWGHEVIGWVSATIVATSDDAYRRLIAKMIDFYAQALFNPRWGEQIRLERGRLLWIRMLFQGLDREQAEAVWRPFADWIAAAPQDFVVISHAVGARPGRTFWDPSVLRRIPGDVIAADRPGAPESNIFWAGNLDEVGWIVHAYQSLWLPASLLDAGERERLVDALVAAADHWGVELQVNKGLAGGAPEAINAAKETAMNPAVVDAFALAISGAGEPPAYPGVPGHEPDVEKARRAAAAVTAAMGELRKLVPRAASYVWETDYFEPNWQDSFWGDNYARLRAIKEKYDPDGLFFLHHGVGSEDWSADGFTRVEAR